MLQYTGVHLYDYAVSGAMCDAAFSPSTRNGVQQDQVPAFLVDVAYTGTGALAVAPNETVYALWIGTNDLGPAAFFTDNRPDLSILDYLDCVYAQLDALYAVGARNFVLLNLAPLNHAPEFARPEYGGVINSQYWKNEDQYSTNVSVYLLSLSLAFETALSNVIKMLMSMLFNAAHWSAKKCANTWP